MQNNLEYINFMRTFANVIISGEVVADMLTQYKGTSSYKRHQNPCIPLSTLGCRDSSFLRLLQIVPSVATKEQVKSQRQKAPKNIDLVTRR